MSTAQVHAGRAVTPIVLAHRHPPMSRLRSRLRGRLGLSLLAKSASTTPERLSVARMEFGEQTLWKRRPRSVDFNPEEPALLVEVQIDKSSLASRQIDDEGL